MTAFGKIMITIFWNMFPYITVSMLSIFIGFVITTLFISKIVAYSLYVDKVTSIKLITKCIERATGYRLLNIIVHLYEDGDNNSSMNQVRELLQSLSSASLLSSLASQQTEPNPSPTISQISRETDFSPTTSEVSRETESEPSPTTSEVSRETQQTQPEQINTPTQQTSDDVDINTLRRSFSYMAGVISENTESFTLNT